MDLTNYRFVAFYNEFFNCDSEVIMTLQDNFNDKNEFSIIEFLIILI